MIWTQCHLAENARSGEKFINRFLSRKPVSERGGEEPFRIGIVGGGPKGLYALDHFLSKVKNYKRSEPVEVFWFNATNYFGCGPNYNIHQPEYLLINYCLGNINAWHPSYGKTDEHLDLLNWIKRHNTTGYTVKPTDFASRALVGSYLQAVTEQILSSCPANVKVYLVVGEVKEIAYLGQFSITLDNRECAYHTDNLILTTGHCYSNRSLVKNDLNKIPDNYVPDVYPVSKLEKVEERSKVGLLGMGLTFIDVALELTEGRGGRFDEKGVYHPSGREPILYPFSRNNFPILARGPVFGSNKRRLHFFNERWLAEMKAIRNRRPIDFITEILPYIEKEVQFAYYSTLLETRDEPTIDVHIRRLPQEDVFNLTKLLFPVHPGKDSQQAVMIACISNNIREAEQGELRSPVMAAASVWREISPIIGALYENKGFTGLSQKSLDEEFLGAFCRTSFGPPAENMKKIRSLSEAGIIRFKFGSQVHVAYDEANRRFDLESKEVTEHVDYLIDARIARPSILSDNAPLYVKLREKGLIEPFENQGYQPGCVRMDLSGQCKTSNSTDLPLFFYGTNTEGFLLDNDSLSRTVNDLGNHWAENTIKQIKVQTNAKNEAHY